ncbi:MAG TPA: RNA chaperone Hfq [Candidatus Sulfotelmatobacter sp.]|jgi:sRNA-binding regulator protein Hfq|nr:RNA chaperone Hfq [Candidatus Sulfotelmatobacter sp.]
MKETLVSTSAQQSGDEENFANRKLIRPALPRLDHNHGNHASSHNSLNHNSSNHNSHHMQLAERRDKNDRHDRPERGFDRADRGAGPGGGRKAAPPEQTNAENFYYQKQMQSRTPMVIVLRDGEEVHGIIEWYDKTCIKVLREDGRPNLMIYKPAIKYMFKEDEGGR